MSDVEISDHTVMLIDKTRAETLQNAWEQLQVAMHLFEENQHASACFLAMTAIEEAGKVGMLQLIRGTRRTGRPQRIDSKKLDRLLRDHQDKALRAAASALCVNTRAKRKYGTHPETDLDLKLGVLLLARTNYEWMNIRNRCLYTDVDLESQDLTTPKMETGSNHSLYFICMAGEVVGNENQHGFGSVVEPNRDTSKSFEFKRKVLDCVDEFTDKHLSEFDATDLEFFTDPRFKDISDELGRKVKPQDEDFEELKNFTRQMVRLFLEFEDKFDEQKYDELIAILDQDEEIKPYVEFSPACMDDMHQVLHDVQSMVVTSDE